MVRFSAFHLRRCGFITGLNSEQPIGAVPRSPSVDSLPLMPEYLPALPRNKRLQVAEDYFSLLVTVHLSVHQYQIIVYLEVTSNSSRSLTTSIRLTAFGEQNPLQEELSLKVDLSAPKQTNAFLAYSYQPVGRIHSVGVSALEDNKGTTTAVESIEINYLYPV
ncbi:hypothetical protein AVEN_189884-1 [Araneus ventricosus]|uniref:Uncharacterized protein n=1 Tax=Araneus ventricosus TaxID=182803 RepID=A0A4Y2EFR9_ARAVE|nr:hypothetical protein AVEN_189884-1 [Araneus ventricosus]